MACCNFKNKTVILMKCVFHNFLFKRDLYLPPFKCNSLDNTITIDLFESYCRSEVESELFNINKTNPVYDYSTEDQSRQMVVDCSRADIYGSGDIVVKLRDSARDLSRGPSVRGSAAASFSGLPAPSMRTSRSHIIHVKYDKITRREEPAIYRDTAESFQDT